MPEAAPFIKLIKEKYGNNSPKVILDVGSRDLGQSIEFTEAFPDARVIAFEPNPEALPFCRERLKGYPKIELYEFAVSDTEGMVDFYITAWPNTGASSLLKPNEDNDWITYDWGAPIAWKKTTGIPCRRLDNVLPELGINSVEVIWMDVQGAELFALKGMGSYFDDVKLLHAEAAERAIYQGQPVKQELEQWLHERDFDTEFVGNWQGHSHGEADLICIKRGF